MKRKITKKFISFTLTVIMMFCLILEIPSITLTVNADTEESYIVDCIRNYEVVDNDFAYYTVNIHIEISSSVNRPNYLQLYVYEYTNNVKGKRIIDGAMTYPWETGINLDLSMNISASKNNTNGMYLFELGYTLGNTTGSDFTLLCEKAGYLSFNDTIISVSNITLNKNATSIMVGNTEKLTATVNPFNATNQNIKWSSSNTSIATIDSNGKITAVSEGTATITVTTIDGDKIATCDVTVITPIIPVNNVILNKNSTTIAVGNTETLTATVNPFNATNKSVSWNSSNTNVATVNNNGKITAVSSGTTTVTVMTVDGGKTAICTVTVINTHQDDTIPADAIHIKTAEQLASIDCSQSASKYYVLDNDIDLQSWGNWTPIGSEANSFRGIFDGNGYTIKNINVNVQSTSGYVYAGLFGYIYNSTIKNLGIGSGNICATSTGYTSHASVAYAGGITSFAYLSTISNCYNMANIIAVSLDCMCVGGIVGSLYSSNIVNNCYNTGSISATGSGRWPYVGGICGASQSTQRSTVDNCYNVGNISNSSYSGGIMGPSSGATITNCYYLIGTAIRRESNSNVPAKTGVLTDTEMHQISSFVGWDFHTVWAIDSNVNNGYPYLRNENGNTDTSEKDVKIFFRINDWIKNGINEVGSVTLPWKDSYFEQSSYIYNHSLARIASALSASAYISNDKKEGKHILASLASLGFENRVFGNYSETIDDKDLETVYNTKVIGDLENIGIKPGTVYEEDPHTVGYSFSYKPIMINNEIINLICVVVRGTALEEWISNFAIWKDGNSPEDIYHYGFKIATDRMAKSFEKYINDNGLTDKFKNKIFITGHSRGAAIANLFAAQIIDSEKYAYSSDIYAYTFATPNGTKDVKAKDTQKYRNIFNIINAEDFVPYFMLSDENWGYWKYGRTFVFPSENVDKNYHSKYENLMNENFINITGDNFNKYENGYNGYGSVQKFIDDVKKVAPTVYDFYNTSYELKYIPDDPFSIYLTPKEYFDKLLEHLRFGNQAMYFISMSTAPFFGAISRFLVGNEAGIPFIGKNLTYSHTAETYVSWMLTVENQIDIMTTLKKVTVACPVNVMIYDKDNNLIGEIINNNIELSNEDIGLYVDNDIKTIYLPENEVYHFEFTGTDIGLMNYTVSSIDFITSKEIETKHFNQVSLYNGKEMISTIDMVSDTKLFVKKNSEIIKEILQDGTEILLVQLPQITNIMANQTYLNSMGGEIKISINGKNLIGQDIKVYLDGEENTVAEIIDDKTAIATAIIPINLTIHDETHIISVYLNGEDIHEYICITVAKPDQETGITILQENVIAGNGQGNINFNIKFANGKGYSIYLSENDEDYTIYTNVNYNSKGVHIRGLKNEKTYYIKIAYTDNGVTIMSNTVVLIPLK